MQCSNSKYLNFCIFPPILQFQKIDFFFFVIEERQKDFAVNIIQSSFIQSHFANVSEKQRSAGKKKHNTLRISTITECRAAQGYRISSQGKHLQYWMCMRQNTDQEPAHLTPSDSTEIYITYVTIKPFSEETEENVTFSIHSLFFFRLGQLTNSPPSDNQLAGHNFLVTLLLQCIFLPLHKGSIGNYK